MKNLSYGPTPHFLILSGDIQGWPADHYAIWKVALGSIIVGEKAGWSEAL